MKPAGPLPLRLTLLIAFACFACSSNEPPTTAAGGGAGASAGGAGAGSGAAGRGGGSSGVGGGSAGASGTGGGGGASGAATAGMSGSSGGSTAGTAGATAAGAGGSSAGTGGFGEAGSAGEQGDAGEANSGAGAGGATNEVAPADVFRPSTRFTVVNPVEFGAESDDSADVVDALDDAVAALPETGGIVLFPSGTYWKDERLWRIQKDHVLVWSPNRRATLHGTIRSRTTQEVTDGRCGVRQQATFFQRTVGGGVYGLRFTSNATERTSCAEDGQIVLDGVDGFEVVGVEVNGAAAAGFFAWSNDDEQPSRNLFVEGSYFHHTYADSVHHTAGARNSACWNNYFFNEAPSLGDDGIACVTYAVDAPRCGNMEWFDNIYLGGMHGRGMAVIGGEDISIHHNWIIGSASAGLIVASENAYTSASSERIELLSNWIVGSPNGSVNNGHSAILISGGNTEAPPLSEIESRDNVIIDAPNNRVERAEGRYDMDTVTFDDSTDEADLPGPQPTRDDVQLADTSVMRTRDLSFVAAAERNGLYRIHVRETPGAAGIQERFEYIVSGPESALNAWLADVQADGGYLSEARNVGAARYALVLAPAPLTVPEALEAVSFEALRAGDRDGTLSWLWSRANAGDY